MKREICLATNLGRGGVSALILTADSDFLQNSDFAVSTIAQRGRPLTPGELLYGVIRDSSSNIIDEVVICAYSPQCRIITGHGGSTSALALRNHYLQAGFTQTSHANIFQPSGTPVADQLISLLTQTKTEAQALRCLQALNQLKNSEEIKMAEILDIMRPRILALAGAPNTGKSSLLNRICGYERVLVSDIAGTTLDAVRDYINLGGYYTHIIDTAGFRLNAGSSEKEAIKRGREVLQNADVILLLFDGSRELSEDDRQAVSASQRAGIRKIIPLLSKADLPQSTTPEQLQNLFSLPAPLPISSITGTGTDLLLKQIASAFAASPPPNPEK